MTIEFNAESFLFDMYGRELDRVTGKLLPNGKQHFGLIPIIRLDAGWYSFNKVNQELHYIKIDGLNCGTDRKAINQAKKIDPTLTNSKLFFIDQAKELAYQEKFKEDLAIEALR